MSISAIQVALSNKNQVAFGRKMDCAPREFCEGSDGRSGWDVLNNGRHADCPPYDRSNQTYSDRQWDKYCHDHQVRPRGQRYSDNYGSDYYASTHGVGHPRTGHSQGIVDGITNGISDVWHAISRAFTHFSHLPTQDMIIVGIGFMVAGALLWTKVIKPFFDKH